MKHLKPGLTSRLKHKTWLKDVRCPDSAGLDSITQGPGTSDMLNDVGFHCFKALTVQCLDLSVAVRKVRLGNITI